MAENTTLEQQARDLLERAGIENAQSFTAGDLVEIANLLGRIEVQSAPAVREPFDRTTALVLLQAASKSGDPGAISLAAQLAGAAPCTDCGYVNFKCRCAATAVPDGWVIVPREPTPEQIEAIPFPMNITPNLAIEPYRAMVSAAPAAPAVNCEWTNCPRRVGDVCCNDRPAAPAVPAVREPLTREAVDAIWNRLGSFTDRQLDWIRFARAIERAHGITGDSK